jgi:hypothetical protein
MKIDYIDEREQIRRAIKNLIFNLRIESFGALIANKLLKAHILEQVQNIDPETIPLDLLRKTIKPFCFENLVDVMECDVCGKDSDHLLEIHGAAFENPMFICDSCIDKIYNASSHRKTK